MNLPLGLINRFIRFSAIDGPGNRFVIFFQGCNQNCINCHNPHTMGECNLCGVCIDECPAHALSQSTHSFEIQCDEALCRHCDTCLEVCPQNSTPHYQQMSVESVLAEIRKAAPFLSGITTSGGEATQQPEFLHKLFSTIKSDEQLSHLSLFVDSNGNVPKEIWDYLMPVMDQTMLDLKALDNETHQKITGASNQLALQSIQYLHEWHKLHEVRLLLIPGMNDQPNTLEATACYFKEINPDMRIRLIPFRQHGVRAEYHFLEEMKKERLLEIHQYFHSMGLQNTFHSKLL